MTSEIDEQTRRNIRRSALLLAGVAAFFFFGFILLGVLRG